MAGKKPVLLKPYSNAEREQRTFSSVAEVRNPQCRNETELAAAVADADVLIADVDIQITRSVLAGARWLRGIMACSIGVDYVDLQAATEFGIYVANLPDYCINAVAEFAIGLAFSLSRHIPQGADCVRSENWNGRRLLKGIELRGRRLGLVGFGKIGQLVGQKGLGLGMAVSYFDPLVGAKSPVAGCAASATLGELLAGSDVVSIHVPLSEKTRGLISYDSLARMKPSALLINVSRGGIVDEAGLYRALKEKKIAGAALDVLAVEPIEPKHPLTTLDNVLITPHMAWNTEESKANSEGSIVEQVNQLLEGHAPTHLVNRGVVPHGRTR
ncbi:MAG: C-terminal binding protein [Candidatus Bipolaricaulota bacterium]|nr:C-terminal binding protein [Candidatus Bipolaricaulota bacterium]